MKNNPYIACVLLLIFLGACTAKKVSTPAIAGATALNKNETKQFLNDLTEQQFDYATYQGRAKAKIALDNKSFNATASVRIKQGEAIWISFTSFLSIEVARVLITPTQIKIINRLQSTYIEKPFDYVYGFTGSQMSFHELESMLTGNTLPLAFNPNNALYKTGNGYQITGTDDAISFDMNFTQQASLNTNVLAETSKNQKLTANYSRFNDVEGNRLPQTIQLNIKTSQKDFTAEIVYDTITLNAAVSQPFSVPESYNKAQ